MTVSFSIVSYNIHKGFSASNRRFILPDIRQALTDLDPDLLLLQEIQGEHSHKSKKHEHWPDVDQAEYLAEQQWRFHVYGKNAVYRRGHHGNAILSRFPIQTWENINVALMKSHSRSLLHAEIASLPGSEPLHLICVHLGLFSSERDQQYRQLLQRLHSHVPDSAPLIIAGDFNDWPGSADRFIHAELGVREAFEEQDGRFARSFPALKPVLTMDRIYYRGLDLVQCKTLTGRPWRRLSDHVPLLAEFLI